MKTDKLEIQDVCIFVGGSQPPKEVFSDLPQDGYVRLIQIRDYKTDRFITYIPQELARRFCDQKDIMIGRYGPPIFQICRGLKGAYNVALMKAVPKENILHEYLYYFLKQDSLFQYIDSLSLRTSGQTGVDIECLKKYPIYLPTLHIQQKIADILSTLDAKIELNNRINAELENLAKTIYDYWFVQFDFPDRNGKPYKSSGGEMVCNKECDRAIPAGWKVRDLGDFGIFKNGVNYDPSQPGDTLAKIVNVRNISGSSIFIHSQELDSIYLTLKEVNNYLVTNQSILIARSGIPGSTRLITDYIENTIYCGFIICFEVNNENLKLPLFFFLKNIEKTISSQSGGTIMKNINQSILKSFKLPLPKDPLSSDLVQNFKNKIEPILQKINLIDKENQQLTQLRDWLLPMLMNGQISIK